MPLTKFHYNLTRPNNSKSTSYCQCGSILPNFNTTWQNRTE